MSFQHPFFPLYYFPPLHLDCGNQDGIENFFFICRQCSPSFGRILGEISQEPHRVAEGRRCDNCGTPYRTQGTGGLGNGILTPTTQYIKQSQDTYASSSARPDTGDCYAELTTSIAVTAPRLLYPRNSTSDSGGRYTLEGHFQSDTPPARNLFTSFGG